MYCAGCGQPLKDNDKFCKRCGRVVAARKKGGPKDAGPKNTARQPEPPKQPKRKKSRGAIAAAIIAAACVATVAVMAFVVGFPGGGVRETVTEEEVFSEQRFESPYYYSDDLFYIEPDESNVAQDPETEIEYVDNEIILYCDEGKSPKGALQGAGISSYEIVGHVDVTNSYQVRLDESRSYSEVESLCAQIESEEGVQHCLPHYAMRLEEGAVTEDPAWTEWDSDKKTWGLRSIKAPEAWEIVTASSDVHVGIIDSQIFADHEDLDDALVEAFPTASSQFDTRSELFVFLLTLYHGTHVAGIVGAEGDNHAGSVGVAYGASLYGYTYMDKDSSGNNKITYSYCFDVGLTYLVCYHDCRVINVSLAMEGLQKKASSGNEEKALAGQEGMLKYGNYYAMTIKALIEAGYDDFIICKGAGNYGAEGLADWDYLGCITDEEAASRIIVVGALAQKSDGTFAMASFSSCGNRVDVVAPGMGIYSTTYYNAGIGDAFVPYGGYSFEDGTSMAAPMVSGVAALVIAANPDLKGDQIKEIICGTAKGVYTDKTGVGRPQVDAEAAVKLAYAAKQHADQQDSDSLSATEKQLAPADYSVEYQYRARGFNNDPNFECVVGDELADGTVVGTQIADFDGDGADELLSVLWRNDTIDLEMYELEGGSAKLKAAMSDSEAFDFPIKGAGTLDVAVGANGALYVQWWENMAPVASVHDWTVMRVDYDGSKFSIAGKATVAGTGTEDLKDLKTDMKSLGLNVDYLPDQDHDDVTYSSIADLDGSLTLITRARAWVDTDAVGESVYRDMQNGTSEWSNPKYLGKFSIGPTVPAKG